MAANYNCLLFDLDGTLFDFAAAEHEAILGTLEACGLPATEENARRFSEINTALWADLERGGIKKDRLVVQRFKTLLEELSAEGDPIRLNNTYMTRLSAQATPFPGADEVLAELAEFATLAAVSNGVEKVAMSRLEKSNLLPFFDEVFISEKVGCTKPNAKFFEVALKKLGVANKEKVLVIGDSLMADIQGGTNAGLATCWCNFSNAENTTNIQPTYAVKSYAELKVVAVGEEGLQLAATREKRHTV